MAVRISFTMDTETMDLIDKFAKDHGIDRNRAILELIESGYTHITGGHPVMLNQKRSFEEYHELNMAMKEMQTSLLNLTEEIQLIHHIIDTEMGKETKPVPYQTKKWWEFRKTP